MCHYEGLLLGDTQVGSQGRARHYRGDGLIELEAILGPIPSMKRLSVPVLRSWIVSA